VLLESGPGPDRIGPSASPDSARLGSYETLVLPARYFGTAVETVSLREAAALEQGLVLRIRGGE
jgi:hypothetical protein